MKFKFSVPNGIYDQDDVTETLSWKTLEFTEKKKKMALKFIEEYMRDDVAFTVAFVPKHPDNQ